jgi:uncharacterized protein YbjT (DUF2867 family)
VILVVGGTGTLGRELLPSLVSDGLRTRVVARHEPSRQLVSAAPGVEWIRGDVRSAEVLAAALAGVDTVVSAIAGFGGRDALGSPAVDRDGNIALVEAARSANVRSFIMLSIHQAGPSHPIGLFRDKWAAEEALRASGLESTIIRPTAYLESWLGLIGGPLVKTGRTRLFGSGRNPINFVSAVDVARFVQLAIADSRLRGEAIEVPGPENLTLEQLAEAAETVSGRIGRKDHIPRPMMRVARLATRVMNPVLSSQIAAGLVMDTRNMAVDGPALRAAFPSIPMTTAAEVAGRMFGAAPTIAATAV